MNRDWSGWNLCRVVRECFFDDFWVRFEGNEVDSYVDVWVKSVLVRWNSKCKGLEMWMFWVGLRNSKEGSVIVGDYGKDLDFILRETGWYWKVLILERSVMIWF